jgi:DNA processing protein
VLIVQFTDPARAALWLMRAAPSPAPHLSRMVTEHGLTQTATRLRSGLPDAVPEPARAEHTGGDPDITADLALLDTGQAQLLTPADPAWPCCALADLDRHRLGAPFGLWIRGNHDALRHATGTGVTVDGARAASSYGEHVAGEFAQHLAAEGVRVLSGGGFGIGAAALRGALATTPPTAVGPIVVLTHGIDTTHPHAHQRLFQHVADSGGALITEHPPGTHPTRTGFVHRARLLAALANSVLIVEAGMRSGAFTLAEHATTLRRPVYATPGPITSSLSAGPHRLIRDGLAQLIETPDNLPADLAGGHAAPS